MAGLFIANLAIGSVNIPIHEIGRIIFGGQASDPIWNSIIWDFRMTKALTCVLAGGALSLGGLQMQTLFRNALAGPDVLGLSSGASLAVSVIFMSHAVGIQFLPADAPWAVATAAALGAGGVFLMMLAVSRHVRDNVSLLIIGLMVGAATSSIVSVLQYLSKAEEMQVFILWTFGNLGSLNWSEIVVLTAALLFGSILAIINMKSMNAWMLGERYAQSLGIKTKNARLICILSASILTGGVTAFCGPIAFVGLAVPHLVKMLIDSSNHKILIPAVLLGGASLLLLCNILAELPKNYILPINAITALIGAPVVVWVILGNRAVKS
jgi:iron complex transport system permease protein